MAHAPIAMTYFGSAIWLYSRTICGAIFFVTVPATIIKSAWRSDGQTRERDRKWHEKNGLDVEDQEDDGVKIILRVELDVRVADRFHSAFVDRCLIRARLRRLKKSSPQPGQRQRD